MILREDLKKKMKSQLHMISKPVRYQILNSSWVLEVNYPVISL